MKLSIRESIKLGHLKCNGYKTRIYISSTGKVFPCDLLQTEEYNAGNIMDGTSYWNGVAAQRFREKDRTNSDRCKDCTLLACNMGCFVISGQENACKWSGLGK